MYCPWAAALACAYFGQKAAKSHFCVDLFKELRENFGAVGAKITGGNGGAFGQSQYEFLIFPALKT